MWVYQVWDNTGEQFLPKVQLFDVPQRSTLGIARSNIESFSYPRQDPAVISLNSTFHVGIMPNWYFERYVQFLSDSENETSYRNHLLGIVDSRKLYFSESIIQSKVKDFMVDSDRFNEFVQIVNYTGDLLVLDVEAPTDGYLSFIDNWDSDWLATVDEEQVAIERLFGTFKSVPLSGGEHRVVFAYRPRFF
ncbi:YfhO family protein [bacterium]|nr:YfhO family protein [bacterium]